MDMCINLGPDVFMGTLLIIAIVICFCVYNRH